jgi:hypothetical protein
MSDEDLDDQIMIEQMTVKRLLSGEDTARISTDSGEFVPRITQQGVKKLLFQPSFAHFNSFIEALISNPQGTPKNEPVRGNLKQK